MGCSDNLRATFKLIISLALILLCCTANASQKDNTLRLGLHVSAMGTLDPHFAAGSQDRAFADMVFNGILRYVPGNAPRIEPDLAEKMPEFRLEHGKQVWTITLRKGVYFHAGPDTPSYELTADDVIYSLSKSADKQFCAYAGNYTGLILKKTNKYSLEIITDSPISSILFFPKLTNYGGGFIVSRKAIEAMGYERFKTHPIGTGPFKFLSHTPKNHIKLTANDTYFRGRPKLDGVEIHFMPSLEAREAALKQKKLDVIIGSGKKGWIKKSEKETGILIDTLGAGEVGVIHLNTRFPPLDDIRVRKAIALALDRRDFLNTTSPRITGSVYSPVPNDLLPGGISEKEARLLKLDYGKNLTKAKELLVEAGYPNGFSLELISSEKRIYQKSYEILKTQLAKIGIQCQVQVVSHNVMHKEIRTTARPIVIYYAWRPNADAYLTRFFHSDSIVVKGKRPDTNFSNYDRIDKLIESARSQTDPQAQINLWIQAQIRILNDMAALPVMFTRSCYARADHVDYGHTLVSTMALYPQFTENTHLIR
ncbi:MAG: ABC transporter substrate-binding protein [Desulfobacterales bacterium]|nr:ABC transporter substrate-binding protein [Desulfobacterales bacterium]